MPYGDEQLVAQLAQELPSAVARRDQSLDATIRQQVGTVPDAVFGLVQIVLVQKAALDAARAQAAGGPFSPASPASAPGGTAAAAPAPQPGPARPAAPGGGSFLRTAATAAVGGAAGAALFEGASALFGEHREDGGSTGQPQPEVVENIYEGTPPGGEDPFASAGDDAFS